MNIKSVESLKTWLSAKLEPICDADPAALAKYVLALLKKNKSVHELKELCIDQLEVFLSSETKRFVDKLFDALASESYMDSTTPKENRTFAEPPARSERISPPPAPASRPPPPQAPSRDRRASEDFSRQESLIDDDDRDFKRTKRTSERDSPRRRSPLRSRRPTSPISVISTINSRSRNWDRDRHGYGRRGRDDDMRRRRREDEERRRYDDKEYHHGSGSGRGGLKNVHERLGPRSDGFREESNLVAVVTSAMSDEEGEKGEEKGEEIKGKCRDYEEKGFCIQGDQCPYEHGNAVVMEDNAAPSGTRMRGGFLPPRRPMLPMMNPVHPGMLRRHGDQFSTNGYNPEAPSFDGQQLPPPLPPWSHPMMPIPPMPGGFGPRFGPRFMGPYPMPGGPRFDRKRPREPKGDRDGGKGTGEREVTVLGSQQQQQQQNKDGDGDEEKTEKQKLTATLLLKKVPNHLNNISKLNGYFQRFGTIVNMQVGIHGDPESALIQFASHAGAKRAHDCPEAVFNNRFIKVFWYKDEMGTGTIRSVAPTRGSKSRGGGGGSGPPPAKAAKVAPLSLTQSAKASESDDTNSETPTGKPAPRSLPSPGALSLNKVKPVAASALKPRKEIVQKNLELQKQKQALMAKQLEQQKLLITMLETNKKMSREDKLKVMETLKSLSESIASLKESAASGTEAAVKQAASVQTPKPAAAVVTTPEGSRDQADSSAAENSGDKEGSGSGLSVSPKTFERQQRQILVTGFSDGSADDLTEHISDFASIENILVADSDDSSYLVTLKSRRDAEIVMAHGGVYKAKPLTMEWFKGQNKVTTGSQEESSVNEAAEVAESVDEENDLLADPDAKETDEFNEHDVELEFEGDEEEEEEEGSRSWRGR